MGKSDPIVYEWYRSIIDRRPFSCAAFLGFPQENDFTRRVLTDEKDFFDLQLRNWDINDETWDIPQGKYDIVVCTRCAYFAQDPTNFVDKIKKLLTPVGAAYVDWGLGDHWRFSNYKVGWVKGGEHEHAFYGEKNNHLFSCYWDASILEDDANVVEFRKHIENFGYRDEKLTDIVMREVPSIVPSEAFGSKLAVRTLFLWPESPQLYIMTIFGKV